MKIKFIPVNMGTNSTCENPCEVVKQLRKDNPHLDRQNLIALAQGAGVNYYTAQTQVYKLFNEAK